MPTLLHDIRSTTYGSDVWFHAGDVARVLGAISPKRLLGALDPDEFVSTDEGTFISEPGFYRLALNLHRPRAGLKRYLCHTLLPALRETGRVSVGRKVSPEALLLQVVREAVSAAGAGVDQPASAEAGA